MAAPEPGRPDDPRPPPAAVPWIQALGIVAVVVVAAIDALVPEFEPPRELYAVLAAAIVGVGPEHLVRIVQAWRRR